MGAGDVDDDPFGGLSASAPVSDDFALPHPSLVSPPAFVTDTTASSSEQEHDVFEAEADAGGFEAFDDLNQEDPFEAAGGGNEDEDPFASADVDNQAADHDPFADTSNTNTSSNIPPSFSSDVPFDSVFGNSDFSDNTFIGAPATSVKREMNGGGGGDGFDAFSSTEIANDPFASVDPGAGMGVGLDKPTGGNDGFGAFDDAFSQDAHTPVSAYKAPDADAYTAPVVDNSDADPFAEVDANSDIAFPPVMTGSDDPFAAASGESDPFGNPNADDPFGEVGEESNGGFDDPFGTPSDDPFA